MAKKKDKAKGKSSGKVGSDPEAIHEFGGEGDFGAPATPGAERDYVARNTKGSDRGASQPGAAERDGDRTHGAGGNASGVGSSSGGDLDTDFIGVGTDGSGLAANAPTGHTPGPDDTDGSSDEMASGGRAKGENQDGVRKVGGPRPVHRSIAKANADVAEPGGRGADATTNPAREDDAFAGEVSSGDARNEDADPERGSEPA